MYYVVDANGDPGRVMTRVEHVETYWACADDSPESLADLYLDFHDFDRPEFIDFKNQLSAAVLVSRSARSQNVKLEA